MKWTLESAGAWTSDAGYAADRLRKKWVLYYEGVPVGEYPTLAACKEGAADHAGSREGEDGSDPPSTVPGVGCATHKCTSTDVPSAGVNGEGDDRLPPPSSPSPPAASAGASRGGTTSVPTSAGPSSTPTVDLRHEQREWDDARAAFSDGLGSALKDDGTPVNQPARLKHSLFPGFRTRRGRRIEDAVAAWVYAVGCAVYGWTV